MFNLFISFLILIPLFGAFLLFFVPEKNSTAIKTIAFGFSSFAFVYSLLLWVFFDSSTSRFQFVEYLEWLWSYNLYIFLGVDGISLLFILLSTLLVPICILASWNSIKKFTKEYYTYFLLMDSILICVFASLDLIVFYIFFESILIPMYLVIGIWGSRTRKIKAGYQFFLYTLIGSVLMLLAIFAIYFETGSTDYQLIANFCFSDRRQILLWIFFFISFAIKVPMMPFHIWLPEAHVEAPTAGSVILAGVLLKMGTYGLLRFSLALFPEGSLFFTPFVYTMSIIAVIYTSLTTLRQIDLKKIIAYSSVAHMGFVTIGIFSLNLQGLEGSLLIMLSHGFISSGLFLCIGVLYERHHTRLLKYYTGLTQVLPLFSICFLFFSMANLGFPGTSSFTGEFLTLVGAFESNTTVAFLAAFSMILGAAYSLWLCNRILFGRLHTDYISQYKDLTKRELATLSPLILCTFWLGLYPEIFLDVMHISVTNLLTLV
uniref:NADH-ubiquinone oxidoreductase chain 4 n=1 Tax=Chroomonas placoidea TaxID=173977 RepID=A0A2P1G882_9CRYP|nr:NADH dehydrogenase subunit 4 [Chroomonas placoidea]AVM81096.1 NADH dehydrogenase subunit 4 [Chroomonas placoidea]